MKVALLPKKTRGETVRFSLRLRHGDLEVARRHRAVRIADRGDAVARHARSATGRRSTTRSTACAPSSASAAATRRCRPGGETVRANLAPVLRLAAEALRTPAFPAAEFDKLIREQIGRPRARRAPTRRRWPSAPLERNANRVPEGRHPPRRQLRRGAGRAARRPARRRQGLPRQVLRRQQRRAGGRRRLRSRRGGQARHRTVRRLEERRAVRAGPVSVPGHGAGQRGRSRRPTRPTPA